MSRERVLILEQNPRDGAALRVALCDRGLDAVEASNLEGAYGLVPGFRPAAILLDGTMPGADPAAIVTRLRGLGSDAAVVVGVTAERTSDALAALRAGAESFLPRPLVPEQAFLQLERALESRRLRREAAAVRERLRRRLRIVGAAPEVQAVAEVVRRVAPTKAAALVQGEAGTGKGHVAQALHEASPRRERPFVRVNCAAVSGVLVDAAIFGHEAGAFAGADALRTGALEAANGGTVYLQEVGRLPPAVQVKLLRMLQQGEFERLGGSATLQADVRVVAGSQADLAEAVRAGRFRDDLYYRLNIVSMALPALRARKSDIPALASHFLETGAGAAEKGISGFTAGALSVLFAYDWPGNVRELENVVARAIGPARGPEVGAEDLPPVLHGASPESSTVSALIPGATLFEIEREAILRTLDQCGGSTARAAEVLGVSVRKIQYRLKEYRSGTPARRQASEVA